MSFSGMRPGVSKNIEDWAKKPGLEEIRASFPQPRKLKRRFRLSKFPFCAGPERAGTFRKRESRNFHLVIRYLTMVHSPASLILAVQNPPGRGAIL